MSPRDRKESLDSLNSFYQRTMATLTDGEAALLKEEKEIVKNFIVNDFISPTSTRRVVLRIRTNEIWMMAVRDPIDEEPEAVFSQPIQNTICCFKPNGFLLGSDWVTTHKAHEDDDALTTTTVTTYLHVTDGKVTTQKEHFYRLFPPRYPENERVLDRWLDAKEIFDLNIDNAFSEAAAASEIVASKTPITEKMSRDPFLDQAAERERDLLAVLAPPESALTLSPASAPLKQEDKEPSPTQRLSSFYQNTMTTLNDYERGCLQAGTEVVREYKISSDKKISLHISKDEIFMAAELSVRDRRSFLEKTRVCRFKQNEFVISNIMTDRHESDEEERQSTETCLVRVIDNIVVSKTQYESRIDSSGQPIEGLKEATDEQVKNAFSQVSEDLLMLTDKNKIPKLYAYTVTDPVWVSKKREQLTTAELQSPSPVRPSIGASTGAVTTSQQQKKQSTAAAPTPLPASPSASRRPSLFPPAPTDERIREQLLDSLSAFYKKTMSELTPEERAHLQGEKAEVVKKFNRTGVSLLKGEEVLLRIRADEICMNAVRWSQKNNEQGVTGGEVDIRTTCLFKSDGFLLRSDDEPSPSDCFVTYLNVANGKIVGKRRAVLLSREGDQSDDSGDDREEEEKWNWQKIDTFESSVDSALSEAVKILEVVTPGNQSDKAPSFVELHVLENNEKDLLYEMNPARFSSEETKADDLGDRGREAPAVLQLEPAKTVQRWLTLFAGPRTTGQPPSPGEQKAKEEIVAEHKRWRDADGWLTRTGLDKEMSLREILFYAKEKKSRTRNACVEKGFINDNDDSFTNKVHEIQGFSLASPAKNEEDAKRQIIAQHKKLRAREIGPTWSNFDEKWSLKEMLEHAQRTEEGYRTRRACYFLGWMEKNGKLTGDAPQVVRGALPSPSLLATPTRRSQI